MSKIDLSVNLLLTYVTFLCILYLVKQKQILSKKTETNKRQKSIVLPHLGDFPVLHFDHALLTL